MKIKLESIDKEVTLAEAKALFEELKFLEKPDPNPIPWADRPYDHVSEGPFEPATTMAEAYMPDSPRSRPS